VKAVGTCHVFNFIEYYGIKLRISPLFPKSSELNSTSVAKPVLENKVTPLCMPVLQIFLIFFDAEMFYLLNS
jgi:hypothetical protein